MALAPCRPSATALSLFRAADAAYPGRAHGADGTCPSKAHHERNPSSWHEPNAEGVSRAVDLTHDPAHRCDCGRISEALRQARDPRVRRCIFGRRTWYARAANGYAPYAWQPYGGTPHTGHMHLDLYRLDDTSPWPGIEEDDMLDYITASVICADDAAWARFKRLCASLKAAVVEMYPVAVADGKSYGIAAMTRMHKSLRARYEAAVKAIPGVQAFKPVETTRAAQEAVGRLTSDATPVEIPTGGEPDAELAAQLDRATSALKTLADAIVRAGEEIKGL